MRARLECFRLLDEWMWAAFEMLVGFASIVGGALLWWWGLTWLVDRIRTKFDTAGIRIINQIIGVAVIVVSVLMLLGLTTNLIRFF